LNAQELTKTMEIDAPTKCWRIWVSLTRTILSHNNGWPLSRIC
jgi:hypothetical protein